MLKGKYMETAIDSSVKQEDIQNSKTANDVGRSGGKESKADSKADIGVGSGKSVPNAETTPVGTTPGGHTPSGVREYETANAKYSEDLGYSVDPLEHRRKMGAGYLVDPETGKEIPNESKLYANRYGDKVLPPVFPDEQNKQILTESKPVIVDLTQEELQAAQEKELRDAQAKDAKEGVNSEVPQETLAQQNARANAEEADNLRVKTEIATANKPADHDEVGHDQEQEAPIVDREAKPVAKPVEVKPFIATDKIAKNIDEAHGKESNQHLVDEVKHGKASRKSVRK